MPDRTEVLISLAELDIDLAWNSRSPANVTSLAASESDEESSGLEGLIQSLLKVGQTTAVDVRLTTPPFYKRTTLPYSLVTGFRRCTALGLLFADEGLKNEAVKAQRALVPNLPDGQVRAVVHGALSEREAYLLNARENAGRENLNPPDTAMMVKRGIEQFGMTIADLAIQLTKTVSSITLYARVAGLPAPILNHWRTGGDFEGIQSLKRASVLDMAEVAKAPPHSQEDAYRKLLLANHAVQSGATTAWFERAKARAASSGNLLAKLEKRGFHPRGNKWEWMAQASILAGTAGRAMTPDQSQTLGEAAFKAYEREMVKAAESTSTVGPSGGATGSVPRNSLTEPAPPPGIAQGHNELVVPQAGSANGYGMRESDE